MLIFVIESGISTYCRLVQLANIYWSISARPAGSLTDTSSVQFWKTAGSTCWTVSGMVTWVRPVFSKAAVPSRPMEAGMVMSVRLAAPSKPLVQIWSISLPLTSEGIVYAPWRPAG